MSEQNCKVNNFIKDLKQCFNDQEIKALLKTTLTDSGLTFMDSEGIRNFCYLDDNLSVLVDEVIAEVKNHGNSNSSDKRYKL